MFGNLKIILNIFLLKLAYQEKKMSSEACVKCGRQTCHTEIEIEVFLYFMSSKMKHTHVNIIIERLKSCV